MDITLVWDPCLGWDKMKSIILKVSNEKCGALFLYLPFMKEILESPDLKNYNTEFLSPIISFSKSFLYSETKYEHNALLTRFVNNKQNMLL